MFPSSHSLLTAAALVAFAANSVLCRLALRGGLIDPASFTLVRLVSGACVLYGLARVRHGSAFLPRDWPSALALFGYAAPFSYAYVRLSTGTGALLLFGSVQATMLTGGVLSGERPVGASWGGFAIALSGLVGLSWPGIAAPDLSSALLMVLAGVAWGIYSLRGRALGRDPLRSTATYFAMASVLAILFWFVVRSPVLLAGGSARFDGPTASALPRGMLYAVLSGALASGVGYSAWYLALRKLTASRAALLQLLVPLLAALFGVLALGEALTTRLMLSGAAILGGVALSLSASGRK